MSDKKGKIIGLGGIFFKSNNPDELKKWYQNNLGLDCDQYGHMFTWRWPDNHEKTGYTQWSVFDGKTDYLNPSKKDFMINYRVEYIEDLVEQLIQKGMKVVGDIEEYEYGKFAWVMDPDGNKIELWEPVDEVITKLNEEAQD